MRDHLLLYLNGEPLRIGGRHVFRTLTGYLREERRAMGTKVVCEEGDCGSCTVLVGRVEAGEVVYRPVNACILHLYQLDGAHVVTVEGLREDGALSEVQEQMVAHHGAQCGFCTPGFITALTALFEESDRPSEAEVREGLTGNLCRCTGYEPIVTAARAVDPSRLRRMNDRFPPADQLAASEAHATEPILVEAGGQVFFAPADVESAVRFKAEHPGAVIVQGGTDVGVWCTKRAFVPDVVMSLAKLPGLDRIEVSEPAPAAQAGGVLEVGGTATLATLEAVARERVPELYEILRHFGSPQIRHGGTLAGNVANASPIADTLPFLYVMEAEIELTGVDGSRRVDVRAFYKGYKQLDLAPDELITRILIPLPAGSETLRLYKVSKRLDLDISSFTAAFLLTRRDDRIEAIRIAYGGVGPVVYRMERTEAFLTGRPFTLAAFAQAGAVAREEIEPITDVRGSRDFRLQLAENVLLKLYHEAAGAEVAA